MFLFLSAIYHFSSLKRLNAPYIILFNVSKSAVMTPWSVINGIDPEPYLSNHTVAFWSQILNTGVETRAFLRFEILPIKGIRRKRFWWKLRALLFTQMSDEALGRKLLLYFCSFFFFPSLFVSSEWTTPSFTTSLCLVLMILSWKLSRYGAFEPRVYVCFVYSCILRVQSEHKAGFD